MAGIEIDEALLLDWTTAIEALDFNTIRELYELQPQLLWTALQPVHLESDFAHFIQRLESFQVLGTSLRPVYPLHHILFDYGVPGDEWASERSVLVDFILKNTTEDELNSCLWGAEENTTMHLAYLLNQPNLTQQLLDKGALASIPNKSGHLPTKEELSEKSNDDQPKLLINKSKPASKEKTPVNTSDRFRRLRELAESPNNKDNKTTTGRQNSTRRYFRPGHLEEKKRRILNEEEEELEKQKLKRQKDIELLAQRSAVKNNPLFKKFEEQKQKVEHKPTGPSISVIRDKQRLLKSDEHIKRSSRVINSLKNSSYVSSSVFRQAQPSEEKNIPVPSLAKLKLASKESLLDSRDEDINDPLPQKSQADKESVIEEDVPDNASSKSKTSALSLRVNSENNKSSSSLSLSSPTASLKSNSTSLFSPIESSFASKNPTNLSLSLKSPTDISFDNKSLSDLGPAVTDEELESLSIGKMRDPNTPVKQAQEKKLIDIGPVKIKDIVNMHEQHNVKEEVEIHTIGRKFEVWAKDASTTEGSEDGIITSKTKDTDALSSKSQAKEDAVLPDHSAISHEISSTKLDSQTTDQDSIAESDNKSMISIQPSTSSTSSTSSIDATSLKSKVDEGIVIEQDIANDISVSDRSEATTKKLDTAKQTQFQKDLKSLEKRAENTTTKIEMHERAIEASVKNKTAGMKKLKSLKLGPEALNQKRALFNHAMPEEPMPTRRNEDASALSPSDESDNDDEYIQHEDIIRSTSSSTSTASSYSKSASTPVVIDNDFGDAQIAEDHNASRFQALHQTEAMRLFETDNDSNPAEKTAQYIPISHIDSMQNSVPRSEVTTIGNNVTEAAPIAFSTTDIHQNSKDAQKDANVEAQIDHEPARSLSVDTSTLLPIDTSVHTDDDEDAATPTLDSIHASQDKAIVEIQQSTLSKSVETHASELDDLKPSGIDLNHKEPTRDQEKNAFLESKHVASNPSSILAQESHVEQKPAISDYYNMSVDIKTTEINETSHLDRDRQSVLPQRASVMSTATSSSDQWFDPDDDWAEQQRQSALLSDYNIHMDQITSRHDQHRNSDLSSIVSDEYYFKRSSSTDHTGLDEDLDDDGFLHTHSEKPISTQLQIEEHMSAVPSTQENTGFLSSAQESIVSLALDEKTIDAQPSTQEHTHAHSPTHTDVQPSIHKNIDIHPPVQENINTRAPYQEPATNDTFEEDDYYSTQLHTSAPDRTHKVAVSGLAVIESEERYASEEKLSSRVHHSSIDQENQEEGEIVVFMDPSDQPSANPSPLSSPNKNHLGVFHQANISTASLVSQTGQYLVVKQEDGSSSNSMIQVPSKTVPIVDSKTEQEYVPHDPKNPRVEDISHYMNTLPTLNKNIHQIHGSSAFDASADMTNNDESMTKRAVSMTTPTGPVVIEDSRGIPNAHEMDFKYIPEGRLSSSEESKVSFEVSQYGKLYIGVSGAHSMLLPLPKEITYVRCVISDGEFEYVSRYEILGPQILMDYECCIDVRPGTIITVSLLVRPDFHVKPKTGWSRFFTSIRKQKEHLSGYVHPEDGAIGQTRFAVDHMVSGCYKKTYEAYFDCFNSWYARTNRERARREQFGDDEDFLKIIGKMNIEMLYLPVSSPHVRVPKSLRECDLTLKIRQWHDTCWQSGYLSTRCQGKKIWERHFYRLIGSQLIGHEQATENIWDHYNIADVIRLSAAADKVIVTLIQEDESKVFEDKTIHEHEQKGFFRLQFPNYYLDCVSDSLEESEEWVKTLKSMIGRVPLKLPFMEE
ncbi:hypothetical protein BD560DRAFT_393531 [Blakeslea trispora]|nr:hypothetical protein BD560DRAFT_393531 [Blakeslea trispora]